MAGISGIQLCRLLRSEAATAEVPVILRGERDDPRSRFWAERAGAVLVDHQLQIGRLFVPVELRLHHAGILPHDVAHLVGDVAEQAFGELHEQDHVTIEYFNKRFQGLHAIHIIVASQ